MKKTLRDIEITGRRALMRVDFNCPIESGHVSDDTRIRAALPTLRYVLERGCPLVLMSHLGRPKGKPSDEFSLKPVAGRLAELLGRPVQFVADCIGAEALAKSRALKGGEVLLLENVRFHVEEEAKVKADESTPEDEVKRLKAAMKEKQKVFAAELAAHGDVFINDAFGAAHRAHASVSVVAGHFKDRVAGFLMEKEVDYLGRALSKPDRPFVAVIGGAKISGKIDVITNLLGKVNAILIGGGMAYTFYKAKGLPIGKSLVEDDKVELAAETLKKAEAAGVQLALPVDHIVADAFAAGANTRVVDEKGIPDGWMALDIGPRTLDAYREIISSAKTVVWNGPMGCFEMEPFAKGTFDLARAIADSQAVSIIGGGDSVSAVNKAGVADRMSHISTGGGASLEFLEGKTLPGVAVLADK